MLVSIEDNPGQMDLVAWYLTRSPLTNVDDLTRETTRKGYDALLSPDGLNYYIKAEKTPDKVYVISYDIGDRISVNFLTTFKMMAHSFTLL